MSTRTLLATVILGLLTVSMASGGGGTSVLVDARGVYLRTSNDDPAALPTKVELAANGISVSSGDGGNPSPSGEEKVVVVWSRAEVPTRRAHKVRSEGALGVDTEVSKESIARAIGDSCARPDPTDRDRARAAHHFGQSGTRPRPRIFVVSPASGYQHDRTVVERDQLTSASSGVSPPAEAVLGPTFLGTGVPGG